MIDSNELDPAVSLFHELFPPGVLTAYDGTNRIPPAPLPEEQWLVARAVPKRSLEFARGRACAHEALGGLGIHGLPILSGARREPLWPTGVVGTISHTDGMCAAAVALASGYEGVGIDLEPERPLSARIARTVCTRSELGEAERALAFEPLLIARLLFCAKESVYKCQYPSTSRFLTFDDVQIRLEACGGFSVQACRIAFENDWPARLRGRWRCGAGFFVAAAWLVAMKP